MAGPAYKPLAVSVQGSLPGVFDTAPVDFEDYEKQAEALQAQELANKINTVVAEKAQQQFDRQNQISQALKTQFGEAGADFDPDQALKLAQTLAIQQGDLDTALTIEKTQKDRKASFVPYSPEERQALSQAMGGVELPETTNPSFANVLTQAQGKRIYGQQVGESIDKRKDVTASYAPGGWETDIDPKTGQGPDSKSGTKFTATTVAHDRINNDLDMLEESFMRSDPNDPTAPEFMKQKALLGDIAIAFKEKNNFGAALTANEERLNNAGNPVVLARPDVGAAEALMAVGLGRDPLDSIRNTRIMLGADLESQAFRYKFKKAKDRPSPSYDPATNAPAAPGGAPSVGGNFNGEKILQVEKIS